MVDLGGGRVMNFCGWFCFNVYLFLEFYFNVRIDSYLFERRKYVLSML